MMKTIQFKIQFAGNCDVYQSGYVEVPDCEDELPEWYYDDQNGMSVPRMFTHHDGIGINQVGATDEQQEELDKFLQLVQFDLVDWVTGIILESSEDENETWYKGDLIVTINDGASFGCRINEPSEFRGDYIVEAVPLWNGYFVGKEFAKYMAENDIVIDPYLLEEDTSCVENGHIYFEISKGYFDPEEEAVEQNAEEVRKDMQIIFQGYLFNKTGFVNDVYEQSLDSDLCGQEELIDLWLWSEGVLTAEQFADRQGYEWEF